MEIKYGIVKHGTYAGVPAYNVWLEDGDLGSDDVVNKIREYGTKQKTFLVLHAGPTGRDGSRLISSIREEFNAFIILADEGYVPNHLWWKVNWVLSVVPWYGRDIQTTFQGNDIVIQMFTDIIPQISPIGAPNIFWQASPDQPYEQLLALSRTCHYPVRILRWDGK